MRILRFAQNDTFVGSDPLIAPVISVGNDAAALQRQKPTEAVPGGRLIFIFFKTFQKLLKTSRFWYLDRMIKIWYNYSILERLVFPRKEPIL